MINITDLDFSYKKKKNLFNCLNLYLSDGNIYGLLGKNGAGKTTLLKIILGILFPQEGNCKVLGLILDEPTNGLDIPSKSQFRKLLSSSISDDRIILISTHQVRDIQKLIDPVIILDNGEIIFQRSMTEVNEKLRVRLVKDEPDPENTLYCEKVIGGYSFLCEDENISSTGVDLEILFDAAIKKNEKLNAVLG